MIFRIYLQNKRVNLIIVINEIFCFFVFLLWKMKQKELRLKEEKKPSSKFILVIKKKIKVAYLN